VAEKPYKQRVAFQLQASMLRPGSIDWLFLVANWWWWSEALEQTSTRAVYLTVHESIRHRLYISKVVFELFAFDEWHFPPQNRCIDGCLACSSNTPIVGKKCQLLLRDKALIIQVSMWHQEDKNRPQNTHCTSPHLCIFLSWSTEGPHYFPPFLLISRQNSKANCPTDTDVERCCRCREKKKAPEQLRETS
jgi:hypothetical protein